MHLNDGTAEKYGLVKVNKSECWPSVTENGGSIDSLHYNLGVSEFKCEGRCPDSNHTFRLDILNLMGSIARHD